MKSRLQNLELLRIVSISLIVIYHFCERLAPTNMFINEVIRYSFGSWGILGVCCFFMITGYFLCEKPEPFSSKKLLTISFEGIFYGTVLLLIYIFAFNGQVGKYEILCSVFAPVSSQYWFLTTYCMLLVFSPFLNRILNSFSKKAYLRFIIITFTILFVLKVISYDTPIGGFSVGLYSYAFGGLLKKYPDNGFSRFRKIGFLSSIIFIIMIQVAEKKLIGFLIFPYVITGRFSAFQVLAAMFLFNVFLKDVKIEKPSKILPFFTRGTLAVYLIHENVWLADIISNKLFKLSDFYLKPIFIVALLGSAAVTVIIATVIEQLRYYTLGFAERKAIKAFEKKLSIIDDWINLKGTDK